MSAAAARWDFPRGSSLPLELRLSNLEDHQRSLHRDLLEFEQQIRGDLAALEGAMLGKFRALLAFLKKSSVVGASSQTEAVGGVESPGHNSTCLRDAVGNVRYCTRSAEAQAETAPPSGVSTPCLTCSGQLDRDRYSRWILEFRLVLARVERAHEELAKRLDMVEITTANLVHMVEARARRFGPGGRFAASGDAWNEIFQKDGTSSRVQLYLLRMIDGVEEKIAGMVRDQATCFRRP